MAADSQNAVKKPRRWRKRLLYTGGICCACLLGLYLLRNILFSGILASYIASNIADATHCKVSIERLSGSWLGDIQLDQIELRARNNKAALQRLHIKSASASYSFFGLLNGFDISDIHHLDIIDVDAQLQQDRRGRLQSKSTTTQQNSFDPALLAKYTQQRLPKLHINGHVQWKEADSVSRSHFTLQGDNQNLDLTLNDTVIRNKAYTIGPVQLLRIDAENFRINGSEFHKHLKLKNGNLHITPSSIDARIPIYIAEQPQALIFHYTKQRQDIDLNIDLQWNKTPTIIRSIVPQLLPQQGRSRIILSLHNSTQGFDVNCMIHADDLLWNIDNKEFKASLHAFIQNNGNQCKIEINDIALHAPAHHAAINNTFLITSTDHELWHVEETEIHTKSGTIKVGGVISKTESDFHIKWDALDLGVISRAFEFDQLHGVCDGSVYIGGKLSEPNIEVEVAGPALRLGDSPLKVNVLCSQNPNGVEIDHCYISYGEYGEAMILGSWPRRLSLNGWEECVGMPPEIDIDIEAKKLHKWPEFHTIFNEGNLFVKAHLEEVNGQAQLKSEIVANKVNLDLFADHHGQTLNLQSSITMDDKNWSCAYSITQSSDQYIKGDLNVEAPGPLLRPAQWNKDINSIIKNINGKLSSRDIHFKIKGAVPRIGDINGDIAINKGVISTEQLSATLGYEPVIINGNVHMGYPHVQSCNVRLQGSRVLLVQSPSLRLRTNCNLLVQKDKDRPLSLSGQAEIIDALYTEEFITTARHTPEIDSQFQLFELPESFLGGAQLDLQVSANKTIRIRNSMLKADASGELRIRGTGMVPEPSGDVLIHQNSRLSLPFSNIWFSPSTITFNASEPFDPSFTINGRTKMQGYDLRIILKGKMSEFSVNGIDIVSNPPISPEEATRLITTGVPPRNISDTGKDIDTSGLVIGWAIVETLRKVFGNEDPERESFFDEIEVQIGRDVSRNGYNTIEVITPIPATDNMYLKLERDKYEDYNGMVIWRTEW